MKATPTAIPDVILLEPKLFGDDRGFFFESFNSRTFRELTGFDGAFVQDNHSKSSKNVLRGLHYQIEPVPQGKLVRVISGAIFDVAVDIRRSSPTFGQFVSVTLTADNKRQVWIPAGFAHGFLALSDETEILYKTTDNYAPECDRGIAWNDAELAIDWPLTGDPILSGKDQNAIGFRDADMFA